jgi:hypothetical protein
MPFNDKTNQVTCSELSGLKIGCLGNTTEKTLDIGDSGLLSAQP